MSIISFIVKTIMYANMWNIVLSLVITAGRRLFKRGRTSEKFFWEYGQCFVGLWRLAFGVLRNAKPGVLGLVAVAKEFVNGGAPKGKAAFKEFWAKVKSHLPEFKLPEYNGRVETAEALSRDKRREQRLIDDMLNDDFFDE